MSNNSRIQLVQRTNNPHNGFVKLNGSGPSVYADSMPPPIDDPDGRAGWLFQKSSGAEKFNYYCYSQGSKAITLGHLRSVHFSGAVDNYVSGASVPFFVVYTKPTGVGDAGLWYHSKVAYAISNVADIQLGELCYFYGGEKPTDITSSYRHIFLNNIVIEGDALPAEEILYMSVHSDSGAADTTRILISDMGFETNNGNIKRNIKLV
tara:strand:+ start:109 stop:729 length:621 start_codon:yes stop_codon:yes gene_type:complete